MTWARGREAVQRLIDHGEVDRVEPSSDVATRLLSDAEAHVAHDAIDAAKKLLRTGRLDPFA